MVLKSQVPGKPQKEKKSPLLRRKCKERGTIHLGLKRKRMQLPPLQLGKTLLLLQLANNCETVRVCDED